MKPKSKTIETSPTASTLTQTESNRCKLRVDQICKRVAELRGIVGQHRVMNILEGAGLTPQGAAAIRATDHFKEHNWPTESEIEKMTEAEQHALINSHFKVRVTTRTTNRHR